MSLNLTLRRYDFRVQSIVRDSHLCVYLECLVSMQMCVRVALCRATAPAMMVWTSSLSERILRVNTAALSMRYVRWPPYQVVEGTRNVRDTGVGGSRKKRGKKESMEHMQ